MRMRLMVWLMSSHLRMYLKSHISGDLWNTAKFSPSAWENYSTTEKRKLWVALGGKDRTLSEWRNSV